MDTDKPSILARGVEEAVRVLCEHWGFDVDHDATEDVIAAHDDARRDATDAGDGFVPEVDDAEATKREALRVLLDHAETLHENAKQNPVRQTITRPPTRPV